MKDPISISCILCQKPIESTDPCIEVLRGTSLSPDPVDWVDPVGAVHLRCLQPIPVGALPMPPNLDDDDLPG